MQNYEFRCDDCGTVENMNNGSRIGSKALCYRCYSHCSLVGCYRNTRFRCSRCNHLVCNLCSIRIDYDKRFNDIRLCHYCFQPWLAKHKNVVEYTKSKLREAQDEISLLKAKLNEATP